MDYSIIIIIILLIKIIITIIIIRSSNSGSSFKICIILATPVSPKINPKQKNKKQNNNNKQKQIKNPKTTLKNYLCELACVCVCVCVYLKYKKVKLVTLVEGDLKAPFSIANTPRWKGGRYSLSWITPFYLWQVPYNAEC